MHNQIKPLLNLAIDYINDGLPKEAIPILEKILILDSKNANAIRILAITYALLGDLNKALILIDKVLKIEPANGVAHSNKGNILDQLGNTKGAIRSYDKAIQLAPDYPESHNNKGNIFLRLKKYKDALSLFNRAISISPNYFQAIASKGYALTKLSCYSEALQEFKKAIAINPNYEITWMNVGILYSDQKRYQDALPNFVQALKIKTNFVEALIACGDSLKQLKRYDEALSYYNKALEIQPNNEFALLNVGILFNEIKHYDEALSYYNKALEIQPNNELALINKGDTLILSRNYCLAREVYSKAYQKNPKDNFALGKFIHTKMLMCDWTDIPQLLNALEKGISLGEKVSHPFGFQALAQSEELLKKSSEIYANTFYKPQPYLIKEAHRNKKIRLGYLCGEFREQATSILMVGVYELHNKNRFETFAFDNGWDDSSEIRGRINQCFNQVVDISNINDVDSARLILDLKIDILVNLNGYFGGDRQSIFALKPAPIQVNYLGFPGTIGASYMDYLIADPIVIPETSETHYSEKIAYLPNSYQANDALRKLNQNQFSRAQLNLPDDFFVFCCFNNNYKITSEIFNAWMFILSQVPKSILWLLADNQWASENLKMMAKKMGVDPERIIFAERVPPLDHLARHEVADLFLDTSPYNAHTTAADALWCGLPVLTIKGNTFPGRVASSLLSAIGLPELITTSSLEYVAKAIKLALNPEMLFLLKQKLQNNKQTMPLFNTAQFTRDLEDTYIQMYEKLQAGLDPEKIYAKKNLG